jgi:hypothetical protein
MEVAAEIKGVLVLLDGFKSAYGGVADGEGLVAAANCLTARTRGFSSLFWSGGWGGIRTLGALLHTRFPSVRIRPLCHPSGKSKTIKHL